MFGWLTDLPPWLLWVLGAGGAGGVFLFGKLKWGWKISAIAAAVLVGVTAIGAAISGAKREGYDRYDEEQRRQNEEARRRADEARRAEEERQRNEPLVPGDYPDDGNKRKE